MIEALYTASVFGSVAIPTFLALDAILALSVGRKVGGIRFLRIGRLQMSFCIARRDAR